MTPATPRTAAGWALRDRLLTALGIVRFYDEKIDAAILAIEAEAAEPAGAGLRMWFACRLHKGHQGPHNEYGTLTDQRRECGAEVVKDAATPVGEDTL